MAYDTPRRGPRLVGARDGGRPLRFSRCAKFGRKGVKKKRAPAMIRFSYHLLT
jgi:hypothetical protein